MKHDNYLLVKESKMSGLLKGFTEIKDRKLVYMPVDTEEFNKKLQSFQEDLKPGESFKFYKVNIGKRYYLVEAAE